MKKAKNKRLPALRFPEFKGDGEWEEKRLEEVAEISTGVSNREDSVERGGRYTFFDRSENIRTSDKFLFDAEAIIIGGEGQDFIPKYFVGKFDLHQRAYAIMNFTNGSIGKYLYYYIYQNRNYFLQYAVGSTVKSLRLPIFKKMQILLPSLPEQQKIASFLSGLDELIAAHRQKLELLKRHKKGLLQQLFPQEGERVPRLRFPEFKGDGEWEEKRLGEVYVFKSTNSLSRSRLNYKKGVVKNIHYGDIHTKFSTLFDIAKEEVPFINTDVSIDKIRPDSYCVEGDIIIADASEDLDDIGKSIEIVNLNNEKLLAGLHTFLLRQIKHRMVIGFGGYLFKSIAVRNQIKKEAQGAKVLGISKKGISNIKICYPKRKKEQQKIASFLSDLDELIAAHRQKLELLKRHKKGLLQQLFPQEGERVPRLRFPEFKGDGEWEEKRLGEVASFVNEKIARRDLDIRTYISTENLLPDFGGVKKSNRLPKYGSFTRFKEQDILMANIRPYLKKVWYAKYCGASSNDVLVMRANFSILSQFLLHVIMSDSFIEFVMQGAKGVKMPRGDKKLMKEYLVLLPPTKTEQQKIASCLSSLDELIEAEAEKIEQLERHKKGLMQRVFPVMV